MRRLRRRAAPDDNGLISADNLRVLLAAANRRIVQLETMHAAALARLERAVTGHWHGCEHAQQLTQARMDLDDMNRRLLRTLAHLRDINTCSTEIIPVIEAGDAR